MTGSEPLRARAGWCGMCKSVYRLVPVMLGLIFCSVSVRAQLPNKPGKDYALTVMEQERLKAFAEQRQKKLMADAQQLLAMAQSLKTSVDATKKDELSVSVIRQADQIEKLAKSVKDRMRQ